MKDQFHNPEQAAGAVVSAGSLPGAPDAPASHHGAQAEPSGPALRPSASSASGRRSNLRFEPLKQLHVKHLGAGKNVKFFKADLTDADLAAMCAGPGALALLADGAPVACGGLLDEKAGRARAWVIIGETMPRRAWQPLIERTRAVFDEALKNGFHRIWAETVYDWPDGHKLLLHLGMAYEGVTRGTFGPGKHAVIYARVRDDVAALPIRVRCMNLTAERCLWEDSMSDAVPWGVEEARRNRRAQGEACGLPALVTAPAAHRRSASGAS